MEQGGKAEHVEQGGKAQNGMREEGTERGAERGGKVRNEGRRCGTRGEDDDCEQVRTREAKERSTTGQNCVVLGGG